MTRFIPSLLIVFFFAHSVSGQGMHVSVPDYDFLHKNQAHLSLPGNDSLLDNFFLKMKHLLLFGEGKINVLHMGGSHVQADVYSNELRQNLGKYAPEQQGARGLVFPFRIARTNGPPDFICEYKGEWTHEKNVSRTHNTRLGLMGISVSTKDTSSQFTVRFNASKYLPQRFNRIKLFHEIDSTSFQLIWPGNDSVKFTPYVDSGYTLIELPTYCDTIALAFKKTDSIQSNFTLFGMYLESDEPGITYNSVGVNGAATWSYLKCELFEQQLKTIHPDLVFFAIGINDAHNSNFTQESYENNYRKIIQMVRNANPKAMFIFITNNDSYSYSKVNNKNAEAVESAMFHLAKEYHGAVWNMFRVMGGYRSATVWRANQLMKNDRIHFNREGYTIMGDLIFNAIMEKYSNYLTKHS